MMPSGARILLLRLLRVKVSRDLLQEAGVSLLINRAFSRLISALAAASSS